MSFNYNHFLKGLKVGDRFVRVSKASQGLTYLTVTRVTPNTIESGTWIFDRKTGGEFELRLGWEPREGTTGGCIKPPIEVKESFPPPGLKSFRPYISNDEDENNLWGEYPW